jgi:hypothetical protein
MDQGLCLARLPYRQRRREIGQSNDIRREKGSPNHPKPSALPACVESLRSHLGEIDP